MKRPRDSHAQDGGISDGERYVRKGGRVKFSTVMWQHPALVPFVGLPVDCGGMDYWRTECTFRWIIWPESLGPLPYSKSGSLNKIICVAKT